MSKGLWACILPASLLLGISLLHLGLGAARIGPAEIIRAFFAYDATNYAHVVVVFQRLTRLVVALYAGAALGLAGLLLQKIMQNGLVSPSTLGINAGATTFVVLAVQFLGLGGAALFLPALAGGMVAILLTFAVTGVLAGQGDGRLNLVLAGSMVGTLFSALTTFVISLDPEAFGNLLGWLIGDIGNFDYRALAPMAPIGLVALMGAILLSRAVDILALGSEQAAVLGVNVRLVYVGTLLIAVMLTVSAVTVVGPIGFVGLVMPHIARLLVGETGPMPLWICVAGGASLLVGADILARLLLAPRVLNVGTVMGLSGGLVFIGLIMVAAKRGRI
ncbi:FecCD family ABC transporter permease [Paracoccus laeviglucosivorans]|nr:iron ABC transporter permease [Paracoccus laeviglucosivorans]